MKLPKSLAACADLLYTTRQERLALQKQVDAMQAQETAIREHLINTLPKGEASGIAGKVARVSIVTKTSTRVEDWSEFYAYVKKNDAFDLLQRRLSNPAVMERLDDGEKVPGVVKFNYVDISMGAV